MIHNDDETKLSENKPMFQTLVNRVLLEQEEKNKKSQLKKTKVFISFGLFFRVLMASIVIFVIYQVSNDQKNLKKAHKLVTKHQGQRTQVRQNSIVKFAKNKSNRLPRKTLSAKVLTDMRSSSKNWPSLLYCVANSPWAGYGTGEFVKVADDLLISTKDRSVVVMTPYYAGVEPVFKKSLWRSGLYKIGGMVGRNFSKYGQTIDLELPYRSRSRGAINGSFFIRYRQHRGMSTPLYQYGIGGRKFLTSQIQQFRRSDKFWPEDESLVVNAEIEKSLWRELNHQVSHFMKSPRREYRVALPDTGENNSKIWQDRVFDQCLDAANSYQKTYLYNIFQNEKERKMKISFSRRLVLDVIGEDSDIDTTLIHRILGYNMPRLQQCFSPGSRQRRFDEVNFAMKVDRSGRVRSVKHQSVKKVPRASLDCVAKEISRIRFYVAQKEPIDTGVSFSFR